MTYMSAKEAADKWGISRRRVAVLCSENRVREATMDMFTGKRAETTMDEIFKMNKSFERSKEKALNRKRLRMASEMDF